MSGTYIVVLVLMLLVVGVLVAGIFLMARGGEASKKYGNKLMVWRVALQASAIFLLLLLVFLGK